MARKPEAYEDAEIYPPSASAGKNNAYYFHCDSVGHHPAYASCLHKIEQRKAGRLETIFAVCSAEIGQRRCPAIDMRKQEQEAGKAIFFVDRAKFHEFFVGQQMEAAVPQEGYTPPRRRVVDSPAPRKTAPAPAQAPVAAQDTGNGYADAINAALRQQDTSALTNTKPPAPAKIEQPRAGMSMLELAKLKMSNKQ